MRKSRFNCRLCNSSNVFYLYSLGNNDAFDYYRCNNCGLVNLDIEGLKFNDHQEKYFDTFIPPEDYEKDKHAKQSYTFIKKYIPIKGEFFDIGCGSGGVLYFAMKNGWSVKGLELSPGFANMVIDRLRIKVDVADFQNYDDISARFDLVTLRHVLEHLPDSILVMNKIYRLLKEGGYAHFEIPNINGIGFRTRRFLKRIGLRKPKFNHDFRPGHCNEFSKKNFLYLINTTGFKLIRWETYSFKPYKDFFLNRIHIGTKARAIVQKIS